MGVERLEQLMARGRSLDDHAAVALARTASTPLLTRERSTDTALRTPPNGAVDRTRNVFARNGDSWTLTYNNNTVQLRDSKGLRYLARLLSQPGREVHVSELAADSANGTAREGPIDVVLDMKAVRAYRDRITELEQDMLEAREWNDAERAARAEFEIAAITDQLSSAYGLAGRTRTTGDPSERVRKAVTNRIKDTLRRVATEHEALGRHLAVTGDDDLGAELAPALAEIVTRHLAGTRFGIGVDGDGLLRQGQEGWALTWMDARIGGVPVTPRIGKPVEVNALWIQALGIAARVCGTDRWDTVHETAHASYVRRFVRDDGAGLLDVVDGPAGDDAAVRPNQLLAVSLPDGPLSASGAAGSGVEAAARAAVNACRPLVTPLGLRSLTPEDAAYRPVHRGSPAERDTAYHQGTVWPWLIGPYVDAARRVGDPTDALLDGLLSHLGEWGIGSVSETADGAAPHAATGCPFQAWSVAELLRVCSAGA